MRLATLAVGVAAQAPPPAESRRTPRRAQRRRNWLALARVLNDRNATRGAALVKRRWLFAVAGCDIADR